MVWPFKRTKAAGLPNKLPFKDGAAFLEFQCEFGNTKIEPEKGIVALVLDATKEFGAEQTVSVKPSGVQTLALKVASKDGGFLVIGETAGAQGDRLCPDDVVVWVPMFHSPELVIDGTDERFGWVGVVIAKIAPEIDISDPNFKILSHYK